MTTYERKREDGSVERVRPVPGSKEDQRLRQSKGYRRRGEDGDPKKPDTGGADSPPPTSTEEKPAGQKPAEQTPAVVSAVRRPPAARRRSGRGVARSGYSDDGLNAAVDGVTGLGTHLAPCTGDPGTDGANVDTDVTPLTANWTSAGSSVAGQADSEQVGWDIPSGGGTRDYTHFAVLDGEDPLTAGFVCGGELDQAEQFSDNGGTLNFTGTITAEDASV